MQKNWQKKGSFLESLFMQTMFSNNILVLRFHINYFLSVLNSSQYLLRKYLF